MGIGKLFLCQLDLAVGELNVQLRWLHQCCEGFLGVKEICPGGFYGPVTGFNVKFLWLGANLGEIVVQVLSSRLDSVLGIG